MNSGNTFGIIVLALLLAIGCEKVGDPVAVTPLPLTGNCVGIVKNSSGVPVSGAVVQLIPDDYEPRTADAAPAAFDSVVSDAHGRFSFTTTNAGLYNVFASGNNRYGYAHDVAVGTNAPTESDIILKTPGTVRGIIHLQGRSDHRSAVILFPGTNRYTLPAGADGTFSMGTFAEGSYKIRLVTTEAGFTAVDTIITVTAGETTTLPVIVLPIASVNIAHLEATFDPYLMRASLAWHLLDTGLVAGYAVYLNRKSDLKPVATLGNHDSTTFYEIIASPLDTFVFQVAAIKRDGTEGMAAVAAPLVKRSALARSQSIPFTSFNAYEPLMSLSVDGNKNIFVEHEGIAGKIDSNGTIVGSYRATTFEGFDDSGNSYFSNARDDTLRMVRLDEDMHFAGEFKYHFYDRKNFINVESIVSTSGAIYIIKDSLHVKQGDLPVYCVSEYTPQFSLAGQYRSSGELVVDRSFRSYSSTKSRICYFFTDSIEQKLGTLGNFDFCTPCLPDGYQIYQLVCPGPHGIAAIPCTFSEGVNERPVFMLVFTAEKKILARIPVHTTEYDSWNFCFDRSGDLYQAIVTHTTDTIVKYPTGMLTAASVR